ncbi:Uncharacterised protein [Vibrio cholerae]|nr:Uncharacterised protein [Vibrio cholerae]
MVVPLVWLILMLKARFVRLILLSKSKHSMCLASTWNPIMSGWPQTEASCVIA